MAEAQWISVAEAAKRLHKSERTVRRQCESGKLNARQESTPSGRSWMVCLEPVESVTDHMAEEVTEGEVEAPSSTQSEEATDRNEATAIVPTLEMRVSAPAANAPANAEVLAEVGELRHDVEEIRAFLAGQIAAEMRDTLAALPSRDDIREDLTTAMSAALTPVMNRLEELAAENAQLQTELHAEKQKALAQVRRPWWKKLFP